MPDRSYSHDFHVDHQGGTLADLTIKSLPEDQVEISSSDEKYKIVGPKSDTKFLMQQLESQIAEDAKFNLY